jgi:uncharacterized protein YegL
MLADDKIDILNTSVGEMIDALVEADASTGSIHLCVITFGGEEAKIWIRHQPIADVAFSALDAGGKTPMGQAFELASDLIEDREALPSRAYRPTVALVSDGKPTDRDWQKALQGLVAGDRGSKATRFALGIGADADREMLAQFSSGQDVYRASEAAQIRRFLQFVTMTITQNTVPATSRDEADADPLADMVWRDDDY